VKYNKQFCGYDISTKNEYLAICSYLLGCFFNRWNISDIGAYTCEVKDLLKAASFKSFLNSKSVSFIAVDSSQKIINKTFSKFLTKELIDELCVALSCNDLNSVLLGKDFFDFHLSNYQKHRRLAPIYWPIATKSNSYLVWLYYPALNDNTLFSIVNELVDPKIKEIAKEVEVLEMKGSAKELNDQKEFLAELEDFKEELLRVAQLPYKPNQNDGVLITAAPLHNLFQHPKWKKSTYDCWKQLEKGEYDWAHLAFSIWPDRVRKKCVKDLSIAITHGLEEICEVKPKETKVKKTKEIKADTQSKLM
jgi:hypothetical protein